MKRTNTIKEFSVSSGQPKEQIQITKDSGHILYNPHNAIGLTSLLNIASGMENLDRVPEYIDNSPWRILFTEDDTLLIKNKSDNSQKLSIQWRDIDDLIDIINIGVDMALDEKKLHPQTRSTASYNLMPTGQILEE